MTGTVAYPTDVAPETPPVRDSTLTYGATGAPEALGDADQEHLARIGDLISRGVDYLEVLQFGIGPASPLLRGKSFADDAIQSSAVYVRARDIVTDYGRALGLVGQGTSTSDGHHVVGERQASYGVQEPRCVSQYRAAALLGWSIDRLRAALDSGELNSHIIGGARVVEERSVQQLRR